MLTSQVSLFEKTYRFHNSHKNKKRSKPSFGALLNPDLKPYEATRSTFSIHLRLLHAKQMGASTLVYTAFLFFFMAFRNAVAIRLWVSIKKERKKKQDLVGASRSAVRAGMVTGSSE